jgi:hypothetical protein
MDQFGIGAAMLTAAQMYSQLARRSGRTTALLDTLKDGDRVVFADEKHVRHFESLLRERGLKVSCIVIPPRNMVDMLYRPRSTGKTVMDHVWLEQYYQHVIESSGVALREFMTQASGEPEQPQKSFKIRY